MSLAPIARCDSTCRKLWADVPLTVGEEVSSDLLLAGFLGTSLSNLSVVRKLQVVGINRRR